MPCCELGRCHESAGRLAEATQAYKRLLAAAADDERRARALWSLARVYDARKLYVAARDAYLDLAARYPGMRLESGRRRPSRSGSRRSSAVSRTYDWSPTVASRRSRPPMFRRWHWSAPADRAVRAMSTEGVVPSLDASRIVLGDRDDAADARRGRRLDAMVDASWARRPSGPATSTTS